MCAAGISGGFGVGEAEEEEAREATEEKIFLLRGLEWLKLGGRRNEGVLVQAREECADEERRGR